MPQVLACPVVPETKPHLVLDSWHPPLDKGLGEVNKSQDKSTGKHPLQLTETSFTFLCPHTGQNFSWPFPVHFSILIDEGEQPTVQTP